MRFFNIAVKAKNRRAKSVKLKTPAATELAGCHRRQNVIQYTRKKGRRREGSPGAARTDAARGRRITNTALTFSARRL